ncbi:hypothetical protein D3C76_1735120 [compost metagenome]
MNLPPEPPDIYPDANNPKQKYRYTNNDTGNNSAMNHCSVAVRMSKEILLIQFFKSPGALEPIKPRIDIWNKSGH